MKKRVVIAGGGLAGLSLGIALRRRDVPVTLHEAGTYPRHRVCGEFISGVTEATVELLGIADHLRDAMALSTARWSDAGGVLGSMAVRARGLSRWRLDERLRADFVESGGDLITHSRIAPGPGIIWAAGRPRRPGRWIGLKCHALKIDLPTDLEMHLGSNGYVGLARVEDEKVNVCGLFRGDRRGVGRGPDLLLSTLRRGGLETLARRLAAGTWDESSFCGVAGFRLGSQSGPGFSIGDAAKMIPPFTGNGMSMAFESAALALDPACRWAAGELSWDGAAGLARRQQDARFGRRMLAAQGLHTFLTTRWGVCAASLAARTGWIPYHHLLALVR